MADELYVLHRFTCSCGTTLEVHAQHILGGWQGRFAVNCPKWHKEQEIPTRPWGSSMRMATTGLLNSSSQRIEREYGNGCSRFRAFDYWAAIWPRNGTQQGNRTARPSQLAQKRLAQIWADGCGLSLPRVR
jgi:hypothetical protein